MQWLVSFSNFVQVHLKNNKYSFQKNMLGDKMTHGYIWTNNFAYNLLCRTFLQQID